MILSQDPHIYGDLLPGAVHAGREGVPALPVCQGVIQALKVLIISCALCGLLLFGVLHCVGWQALVVREWLPGCPESSSNGRDQFEV